MAEGGEMSVWNDLVGQSAAVATLRRAVTAAHGGGGQAMTHAWLFTGPPGSGRSNAARAFAAALQCRKDGCGDCAECRTALSGAHPDVTVVRTEKLSIGVAEVRELVRNAGMAPVVGQVQAIVVEDADRITERGADALLKAIEEPPPRTVWMLCAPTPDEVVITIRSRSRHLRMSTPSDAEVADLLVRRDGIAPEMASHAARAAQGHVGRARVLARDETARQRRNDVLAIPSRLRSIADCMIAAERVVQASADEAAAATADLDAAERAELSEALGMGTKGVRPRHAAAALKELEEQQRARAKRLQRDSLDRVLTELTTWYRDVLGVQTGAFAATLDDAPGAHLINIDLRDHVARSARAVTPEQTVRHVDAILAARKALELNVSPQLAMESLLVSLADL